MPSLFIQLRIALRASSFFSHRYKLPGCHPVQCSPFPVFSDSNFRLSTVDCRLPGHAIVTHST
jgi:hypothetical protein